ncbi:MAG: hypothetical protein JSV98_03465 [candidate division WOR-3 bacterium]|nr:MAG: hypothetical protein JSV98_03465 [candidate division WOR-3 bacterium]
MRKELIGSITLIAILLAACAHKAPPIFKDRLQPKLAKVSVINNRQLQLTFTEEIDTMTLAPDSIFITSEQETLTVLLTYPSLSASEIIAATEPMKNVDYEISGSVFDKAENKGIFKSSFKGSSSPDTITPWITSYSQGGNKYEFFLQFSEAMDTTIVSFAIIPKREFTATWSNHRYVKFLPTSEDQSMNFDTTYYLFLKSARDISGNRVIPFVTSVTPDTSYAPISLSGRALIDTIPIKSGLALLSRDHVIGITLVTNGDFLFNVRDSLAHTITVIAQEYSGSIITRPGTENIVILKKENIDIDSLID